MKAVYFKENASTTDYLKIKEINGEPVTWARALTRTMIKTKCLSDAADILVVEVNTSEQLVNLEEMAREITREHTELKVIAIAGDTSLHSNVCYVVTDVAHIGESLLQKSTEELIEETGKQREEREAEQDLSTLRLHTEEESTWKKIAEQRGAELDICKKTLEKILTNKEVSLIKSNVADTEKVGQLESRISQLNDQLDRQARVLEQTQQRLMDASAQSKDYDHLKEECDTATLDMSILRGVVSSLVDNILRKQEYVEQVITNASSVNQQYYDATAKLEKAEKQLKEATDKITELSKTIDGAAKDMDLLRESNEEFSRDVERLEEDKEQLKAQLQEAREFGTRISDEKEQAEEREEILKIRLASYESSDTDVMRTQAERSTEIIASLQQDYAAKATECDRLAEQLRDSRSREAKVLADLKTVKNRADALAGKTFGEINSAISINYRAKAIIITLMGTGKCGTTSLAVAIARTLARQRHVALIDFNLRAPLIESYFQITPFIVQSGAGSAVSSLQYIVDNGTASLKEAQFAHQINNISVLTGLYSNVDVARLCGINYQELFETLGEFNDYIIVDMGNIESYGGIASIQKAVARIANANIVVCNDTYHDMRSALIALKAQKRTIETTIWFRNNSLMNRNEDNGLLAAAKINIRVPFVKELMHSSNDISTNRKTVGYVDDVCKVI